MYDGAIACSWQVCHTPPGRAWIADQSVSSVTVMVAMIRNRCVTTRSMDAPHRSCATRRAGGCEVVGVGSGPHRGGTLVPAVCVKLAHTNPLPKLFIAREQRPAFIERGPVG